MNWAANYATAVEMTRDMINLVLDKQLQVLKNQNQHHHSGSLGFFGKFSAELTDVEVTDLEDPGAPGGGVHTDLEARGAFVFKLFHLFKLRSQILFSLENVSLDFSTTNAGLPKGIVIAVTPTLKVNIKFPKASWIIKWFLNKVVGRLVAFGIWLAFRIIKKVEIAIWMLVDIFAVLGLRFTPGSPLLTAQKSKTPHSMLVASSFNLTNPLVGNPNQLQSFVPVNTNIGAVVHERVVAAGVHVAFSKGWVPKNFKVKKWRIYLNTITVKFEQDKIVASGSLKAKRGKCWCRVKARIHYRAAVEPEIINTAGPNPRPTAVFNYDADINTQISTSGMLVVLGAIMLAPVFMGLTIAMSALINIALKQFLPFRTRFNIQGGSLSVQLNSVNFSGFIPFQLNFPLQLSGQGTYDLSAFQQFILPGNVPVNVGFTGETISVQPKELRAAVELS